jgi:putative Holliday junction resolvase
MVKNEKNINIVMGFDFGTKRIGVAVGQFITRSATPVTILNSKRGIPDWKNIETLKNEWKANAFVVGMPYNMDGTEQEITKGAKQFGHQLKKMFKLPVYFVDERLTTKEAQWSLKENKEKKRLHNNKKVDSLAAKIILESFLRLNNKGVICE